MLSNKCNRLKMRFNTKERKWFLFKQPSMLIRKLCKNALSIPINSLLLNKNNLHKWFHNWPLLRRLILINEMSWIIGMAKCRIWGETWKCNKVSIRNCSSKARLWKKNLMKRNGLKVAINLRLRFLSALLSACKKTILVWLPCMNR